MMTTFLCSRVNNFTNSYWIKPIIKFEFRGLKKDKTVKSKLNSNHWFLKFSTRLKCLKWLVPYPNGKSLPKFENKAYSVFGLCSTVFMMNIAQVLAQSMQIIQFNLNWFAAILFFVSIHSNKGNQWHKMARFLVILRIVPVFC